MFLVSPQVAQERNINESQVNAAGIRRIPGRHVTLYTDLPSSPRIDELPLVFDAAVPHWCAYFQVPEKNVATWKNVAYLVRDKDRFVRAGLWPSDLPPFLHGYQRGSELWLYEQPSDYYRRHLLLHEGTHAFMHAQLRGAGPPWYMEGVAELLATHRWRENDLTLGYFPQDKSEVPDWGRIKIIKDDFRTGEPKRLQEIMHYDSQAHLRVNAYGWCWAASAFFDGHPAYQQRFREMRKFAADPSPSFTERFARSLKDDEAHVNREWQLYVSQLDYGYDVAREAIETKPTKSFTRGEATTSLVADRGWQSAGIRLAAGKEYRLAAAGRFQLGAKPEIWWSEPGGITIEYYRGRPLGLVLAAIVDESDDNESLNGFLSPQAVGMGTTITTKHAGTLYLRVNDDPAKLADNQGEVTVRITAVLK